MLTQINIPFLVTLISKGEMAERSKATDCNSVSNTHVGSNPTLLKYMLQNKTTVFKVKSINYFSLYQKTLNQSINIDNNMLFLIQNQALKKVKTYKLSSFLRLTCFVRNVLHYQKLRVNYSFNFKKNLIQNYLLVLNFKRRRFFPIIRTLRNEIFLSLSMGLFASFFKKGKFFLKSKIVYLTTALFLRKVLLFSNFKNMFLLVNRIPKYFTEIMSTLNEPVINLYKDPFSNNIINEQLNNVSFTFPYIMFTNNKPYGLVKTKQKGRLKRKISKKIVLMNRILD
jgi:hypothetical protein